MQRTTSKWSISYQLLISIMNTNFDTQPASFLQQFNAWKEQVVRYQQLSGEQLSDFTKLIAVVNGLKGSVRNLVLLNPDSDSSFGDLDSLLARYVDTHDQHDSSLDSLCDRACRDKSESIGKGNDTESNPSFEQQLEEGGTRKGTEEGREKGKQAKEKGKRFIPSLQPTKARGSMRSFQENNGAPYAGRKGTRPKLAGGTATSNNSSTNNTSRGQQQQKLHDRGISLSFTT